LDLPAFSDMQRTGIASAIHPVCAGQIASLLLFVRDCVSC
jgi:hypothetical protein